MELLTVDQNKCRKDGLCVRVCPAGIIRLGKKDGYPVMIPKGEKGCIRCGHCVAVCPHGAISHLDVPGEKWPPIRKELMISQEQAVQFLRSRRSIRSFQERPIEKATLIRLIETARYAPTASNAQTIAWKVWTEKASIRYCAELTIAWMKDLLATRPESGYAAYLPALVAAWEKGLDVVLRKAPALVVAAAPRENPNGMVDVTLALSYLELAATVMGVGTCWAGLLHGAMLAWPAFKQQWPFLESHTHHYPLMIGYSDERYHRLPERKPPRIEWMDTP